MLPALPSSPVAGKTFTLGTSLSLVKATWGGKERDEYLQGSQKPRQVNPALKVG